MKRAILILVWLGALVFGWRSGPWSGPESSDTGETSDHDRMFHMHRPLHDGGKVSMSGQFHLELVSHADGTHRLWISNAFRQEMDPAGFSGTLVVQTSAGPVNVPFRRRGRTKELIAQTDPLQGQIWLSVNGSLGEKAQFKNLRFFWDYDSASGLAAPPAGLDAMVPLPPDNALTADKVKLGQDLFFDRRLSADGSTSCASCHRPEYAFAEPDTVAQGVGGRLGTRNTPSVLNTAYYPELLWDGRRQSLEDQAVEPILSSVEMGNRDEAVLVARLEAGYGTRTQEVMGERLSLNSIARALACYERTLFSGDSDFDRYESGNREAISEAAVRGRSLFFGRAGCGNCHVPPLFTDFEFHNLGVGWQGIDMGDRGRLEVTGDPQDLGAFRTPSLRDVTRTAPYMHDGSIAALRTIVELYNRGGHENEKLDPLITPLGLASAEIDDIVSFLHTLEGRNSAARRTASPETETGGTAP